MSTLRIDADVLTPQGWCRGQLRCNELGNIEAIEGERIEESEVGQTGGSIAIPGFVDLHVHGAGGCDVMDAGDAALTIARTLASKGTTSWLATTMTAPNADITRALEALRQQMQPTKAESAHSGAARMLGVHLEGPYISADKLGAQPNFVAPVDIDQVRRWHAIAPIRVLTLAAQPSAMAAIGALHALGIRVQLGHSDADYDTAKAALNAGASGFTHLFNAMSGLHHRAPGMVGAALAHARHAEIIPDLMHVHPGAVLAALRSIPGLYCVSDSTSATSMPDGIYRLGSQMVHKCLGGVRLSDGTLAGSALTLDLAFRNLLGLGLSLSQASARVSTIAADYLGLNQIGRLQVGARADVVVLNEDLLIESVWIAGERI
jgi:N-acetylglucosamine-6-phosphate deacetylase